MNKQIAQYELYGLLFGNVIKDNTYLQLYIDGEKCKSDGIFIVHDKSLWTVKVVDEKLVRNLEVGISMLTDSGISFEIIEY